MKVKILENYLKIGVLKIKFGILKNYVRVEFWKLNLEIEVWKIVWKLNFGIKIWRIKKKNIEYGL